MATTYLDPPPRNFTASSLIKLSRERMLKSVAQGRRETGMAGFAEVLNAEEIELVVDFVRQAFMGQKKLNTRYHTVGNGWPDHQRYVTAFPFATGDIPLDRAIESLSSEQREGRELFMASCITCHDRANVENEGDAWNSLPVSFPRSGYSHRMEAADAVSSATPYSKHDSPPTTLGLSEQQLQGAILFQENCEFCHAADGTGKNWIGSFMRPPARNLTDAKLMAGATQAHLERVIADGLPETSMPAWRHVLNDTQISAIADYVLQVFVPPATQP